MTLGARRLRGPLIGAAAGLVALASLAVVLMHGSSTATQRPARSEASRLDVATGYRAVGSLGLVFEVPETWGTGEVACDGSPVSDTVAFGGGRDCAVPHPPRVSSLLLTHSTNRQVAAVLDELDLSPAQIGRTQVELSEVREVHGLWTFAVTDAQGDVALLRAKDQAVATHAHAALRDVPPGYVLIDVSGSHPAEVAAELRALGLDPHVARVPAQGRAGIVGLDPPLASVVPRGSRIAVELADP